MDETISDFNTTLISFINFLIGLNTGSTSEIKIYKKVAESLIAKKRNFLIEQFTIHCLPFYKEIKDKNIEYFMDKDYDSTEKGVNTFFNTNTNIKKSSNGDMLNSLRIKKIFPTLGKDKQDLICEYMSLFADYSKCYFEIYKIQFADGA